MCHPQPGLRGQELEQRIERVGIKQNSALQDVSDTACCHTGDKMSNDMLRFGYVFRKEKLQLIEGMKLSCRSYAGIFLGMTLEQAFKLYLMAATFSHSRWGVLVVLMAQYILQKISHSQPDRKYLL